MWPISGPKAHEFLRIGRVAAERWAGQGARLELVAALPLPSHAIDDPEYLVPALAELCAAQSSNGAAKAGKTSLVLESAWLPLMLADTGGILLAAAEIEALVRHRLVGNHVGTTAELAAWDIRVDHRPGERFALAYALAPQVKQSLLEAAAGAGLSLAALVPAFLWGWQRLRPPMRAGWWVWPEQDRLLLARVEAGRLVAFNPAVPLADSGAAIELLVQIESTRWGLPARDDSVTAASWQPPPSALQLHARNGRLMWRSLVGAA